MEQDEEVVTEEPQLRYWNPWRRGRSVFTASAMTPPANPVNPLNFVKMGPQSSVYCDSQPNPSLHPSSIFDNQQSFNPELPFQSDFQNNCDTQNLLSTQASESAIVGLSTLTPLDTVSPYNQSPFMLLRQEEDLNQIIKQEPEDDLDKHFTDIRDDIVTFNSIDEALDSIDPPSTPDSNRSTTSINSLGQSSGNKMGLSNEKHEEVVKAAKSLFSKRTRTLYHWLFPDTSKNKLKATVSAAWETLSEGEKHFYISQVLGRFGLQASSLMVNPQLGGMKCIPNEVEKTSDKKKSGPIEDQRAVDSLFDSCEDAGNWASYSEPKPIVTKGKPERRRRRKRQKTQKDQDAGSSDPDNEQEVKSLKKLKKVHKDLEEFEDPELTKELEKFRLITEAAEEDIWGDIPDPAELFAEIDF